MPTPLRPLPLVIAVFIAAACATTPKPARSEQSRGAPQPEMTFGAALTREVAALPLHDVPFPDAAFKAQVEATGTPKVTAQGEFLQVQIPIGTGQDLSCFVYPEHLDTGAMLTMFIGAVMQNMEVVELRPVEIAPVGIDAVAILHATYAVPAKEGKQHGVLKMATHAASGASLLCFHDEPGYSAAFSRMVQTFARTLTPKGQQETSPRYGELSVLKIGEIPVGFERRRYFDGKGGGRVDETISLMLMPRSATELVAQDAANVTVTDKAGRVQRMKTTQGSGGEVSVDLTVTRGTKNEYAYEGTLSGKAVKGTFKSADANGLPGDELIEELMRTRLFAGPAEPYKLEQYDPEVDLAKPMELTIKAIDAAKRAVSLSYGAMAIDGQVDANGLLERGQISMGPVSLTFERVATMGSP